jgi:hypothetical protein
MKKLFLLLFFTACGTAVQVPIPGPAGPQGLPGIAGVSPTPVQLCAGTTTYPTTFCEVVWCSNGNLYGVYSVNDAFASELPQGLYSSNGINCSCQVLIGPGCEVTQQ